MCTGPKQDEGTNMARAVEWGFFGGQRGGSGVGRGRVDGFGAQGVGERESF